MMDGGTHDDRGMDEYRCDSVPLCFLGTIEILFVEGKKRFNFGVFGSERIQMCDGEGDKRSGGDRPGWGMSLVMAIVRLHDCHVLGWSYSGVCHCVRVCLLLDG